MKVFCFHSVRTHPEVPHASAWPSERHYHEYVNNLRVEPSWYYEFLRRAIDYWGAENITITFDDAYRDVMVPAMYSKSLGIRTIVFTATDTIGKGLYFSPLDTMSWVELKWISRAEGVEIGHHGCSHIPWSCVADNHAFGEIRAGADALSERLPGVPFTLAPPHGSYTKDQYEFAIACGFTEVFGTVLYPAGHFGTKRLLANMSGYRDSIAPGSDGIPWPWEA